MKKHAGRRTSADRAEHYRRLLAAHEESGQSLRAFAASRGVSEWTLYAWRRRFRLEKEEKAEREDARSAPADRLVGVQVVGERSRPAAARFAIELRCERRIEVRDGFDERELTRLIEAVERC